MNQLQVDNVDSIPIFGFPLYSEVSQFIQPYPYDIQIFFNVRPEYCTTLVCDWVSKVFDFLIESCYFEFFCYFRSDHGHHEHESYYGDRDTESLVKVLLFLI